MKTGLLVALIVVLLVLSGCAQNQSTGQAVTGNVVKETETQTNAEVEKKPTAGLDPNGLGQVCGSYGDNFKKICECLGDLERGNDGNYYCKGTCGFDCTCFRDRRVVPCPTE